ncbi:MAG: ribbon-helix-helix domain-containing protein [Rhizobiaceae bacterium]
MTVRKRSISLSGHRTSYSIEEPFLDVLRQMANTRAIPLAKLIGEIDASRARDANLSSALRLAALAHVADRPLKD